MAMIQSLPKRKKNEVYKLVAEPTSTQRATSAIKDQKTVFNIGVLAGILWYL